MLFTEVQRSVRLNKKKKSTNISPYPDEVIDRLARAFYPAILACWNSEEGQREFAAWQAEQAHHANKKEIQEVSRWGTPWCTYHYCLWLLAGYVLFRGEPCFCFAFNLLTHGFWPHSSNIPLDYRSESSLHNSADHCK